MLQQGSVIIELWTVGRQREETLHAQSQMGFVEHVV